MKALGQVTSLAFVGGVYIAGGIKAIWGALAVGVLFHIWYRIKHGQWMDPA